jgi:hypothetical protein
MAFRVATADASGHRDAASDEQVRGPSGRQMSLLSGALGRFQVLSHLATRLVRGNAGRYQEETSFLARRDPGATSLANSRSLPTCTSEQQLYGLGPHARRPGRGRDDWQSSERHRAASEADQAGRDASEKRLL